MCLLCSVLQRELFSLSVEASSSIRPEGADLPAVLERLATISARPRYAFMVLNLIARAAGASGQDAVALANDTPYGLAAYFYSEGLSRVWRVSEALEYGILGVNTGIISTEVAPFGGLKESGIGREGSRYGVDDWLELKYVCLGV